MDTTTNTDTNHDEPKAPTTMTVAGFDLHAITAKELSELVFDGAHEDNLIGIGSISYGPKYEEPYLHCFVPVQIRRVREDFLPALEAARPAPTFFCYNTFAPSACSITRAGRPLVFRGKKHYFKAKKNYVQELCALITDQDVGRTGKTSKKGASLTAEQALEIALDRCNEDRLPVPSLVVFSGRGLQLVWLLKDAEPDEQVSETEWLSDSVSLQRRPVPRTPESEQQWKQTADEIVKKRLQDLAPDRKASKTASNWFRVPGPPNEKSGREVTAWLIGDCARYYSLDELAAYLLRTSTDSSSPLLFRSSDVYAEKKSRTQDGAEGEEEDGTGRKRRNSAPAQAAYPSVVRVRELEKLNESRGGMGESHRYLFVYHFRSAVYRAEFYSHGHSVASRVAAEKVDEIVETFLDGKESFTADEVARACDANPWHVSSNEIVADDLDVSIEEAEALNLRHTIPLELAQHRELERRNDRNCKRVEKDLLQLRISVLIDAGWSYGRVSILTGVPKSTVRNGAKRFKKTGQYLSTDSPIKDQESFLVAQIREEYNLAAERLLS